MTTNLPEFMQEQRHLAEAATPGPWDSYRPNAAYRIFEVCSTTAQSLNETLAEVSGYNADNDSEFVIAARTSVPTLIAAVEVVLSEHTDGGPSQGYFKEGDRWEYTSREHCCVTCGTHGEYGVEWPCPTIRAIEAAVLGGEGDGDS